MPIVRRLVGLVVALVLVIVIAVVGLLGWVTARALPQTSGDLRVAGLQGSVTVSRDAAGIVQIYADMPHDLFLAQGYVHAQERLWQMEVWRHISSGRLSELFGPSELETDEFIRTLGWRQAAQRDLAAMSADGRAALQAYADGVNAFIDSHHGDLGLGFVVAGLKSGRGGLGGYIPEPWTPLDTAAWQKVQSFNLGGNFDSEIFRMLSDARLGSPAMTDELFPPYRADAPVITPTGLPGSGGAGNPGATLPPPLAGGSSPDAPPTAVTARAGRAVAPPGRAVAPTAGQAAGWTALAGIRSAILATAGLDTGTGLVGDHGVGSNDWVVSGTKSASGGALLANDPHLGFSMPSVWFMNGLHCRTVSAACPFDVTGVTFPGVPAVILGHNERISWGATNVGPDVQDLFIETIDPKDPGHYLYKGQSLPFDLRTETIRVAGGPPVTITVRSTIHGPILNDVDPRLKNGAPLLALRWTATAEVDGAFDSFLHIATATDFASFRAAFRTYGSPSQNFVYADVAGHIGYVLPGLIPIRATATDRGDRPVDGASGAHDWTGYIPFADLPWQYDPPSGLIVSANNAAVDPSYPYFIGQEWDPGYRAQRITDLLKADEPGGITPAEMRAIQMDTSMPRADLVIARLDKAAPTTPDGQLLLARIRSWNRRCDVASPGCAAYVAFEYVLSRAVFDGRLGPLARDYVGSTDSWQALIRLLADPTNAWWNTGPTVQGAPAVVSRALDATAAQLRAALGDPSRWTWGRLHTATFSEQTFGVSGIGPLEWYFDHGPFPLGGAAGAVDNTYYRERSAYPDPSDPTYRPVGLDQVFAATNGPSYRLTIDMGDLDGARIVQTTGQSGNPFDRHYGDLVDTWAQGGTLPLPFSRAAVDRATVTTLTMTP